MSMYALLRSKPEPPTEHEIEEALAGNLWYAYSHLQMSTGFQCLVTQGLAPKALQWKNPPALKSNIVTLDSC